jgi:uncharacterized protein YggL (DUF469 family)
LGCEVHFQVVDNLSPEALDTAVDAFTSQAIEAYGWVGGGGGKHPDWSVFVTCEGHGSVTEARRRAMETRLTARPEVHTFQIGPFVDAWYPA